jgi:APA family basic amino acid/polyamine antiporter
MVVLAGVSAMLGVILSQLLGLSRMAFAMARRGDLPRPLSAVHERTGVPHRAELALAAVVVVLVLLADLRGAIGFSSFCVLGYYALANASAFTLAPAERRWPRAIPVLGVAGCVVLAFSLPGTTVVAGAALLVLAMLVRAVGHVRSG